MRETVTFIDFESYSKPIVNGIDSVGWTNRYHPKTRREKVKLFSYNKNTNIKFVINYTRKDRDWSIFDV